MKNNLAKLLILILGVIGFYTLSPSDLPTYTFYHWKNSYSIEATVKNPPRYVKVLDISYHKTLQITPTLFKTAPKEPFVPVIYIDNPTFFKISVQELLDKVLKKLPPSSTLYHEIQVDCDWTKKSQKAYFNFLTQLKKSTHKKLSTTIRLHQIKYHQKTGVPPVAYGVLMYYNMSNFKDIKTKNYILDLKIAKQYHHNFKTYPIPLNLALPLYAQGTIMRFSKVVSLIEGIRANELNEYFEPISSNLYLIKKTHYFKQHLLYEGDKIRIDTVTVKALKEGIKNLKEVMKTPQEVIFYRWGNHKFYSEESLSEVMEEWR